MGTLTDAGTSDEVSVSYDVAGSSTSAGILCHGTSNCAAGDTAKLSTDVAQMPTAITVSLLGDDGWLIDSLSLNANGKACTILAAGSNQWLELGDGYSQVKSFDLRSLCANLYAGKLQSCPLSSTAGAQWNLVRRTVGNTFPQQDQLVGSDESGAAHNDPTGPAFSKRFDSADFDQFLFATGDCNRWMIMSK